MPAMTEQERRVQLNALLREKETLVTRINQAEDRLDRETKEDEIQRLEQVRDEARRSILACESQIELYQPRSVQAPRPPRKPRAPRKPKP